MVDIAYLLSSVGHSPEEVKRRERVANDLVPAEDTVEMVRPSSAPLSVESTIEEQWAGVELLRTLAAHEGEFDAFFVGCFGEPALGAARELTDVPVVGSASATFHTAAQVGDRFSVLTILDETVPMVHRQLRAQQLGGRLASVRVVDAPVLEIDHGSGELVDDMLSVGRDAVEADGADALIPGCMSLSFMQVHDEIQAQIGVPFLDPVRIGLGTASMWARWGIAQSPVAYPTPDRGKLTGLLSG